VEGIKVTIKESNESNDETKVDSKKKTRDQNYAKRKDLQLCNSWLETTKDGRKGTNQSGNVFWETVSKPTESGFLNLRDLQRASRIYGASYSMPSTNTTAAFSRSTIVIKAGQPWHSCCMAKFKESRSPTSSATRSSSSWPIGMLIIAIWKRRQTPRGTNLAPLLARDQLPRVPLPMPLEKKEKMMFSHVQLAEKKPNSNIKNNNYMSPITRSSRKWWLLTVKLLMLQKNIKCLSILKTPTENPLPIGGIFKHTKSTVRNQSIIQKSFSSLLHPK
jgi:hypothetical protein